MFTTANRAFSGAFILALLLPTGCESARCDFTARCEGDELVTCAVPESIAGADHVDISRTKCEGENPVCLADNTWNSGCFSSARPADCRDNSCRGNVHVWCVSLKLADGGPEQWYERTTDCSLVLNSKRQPHVCSIEIGSDSICLNPDFLPDPPTP